MGRKVSLKGWNGKFLSVQFDGSVDCTAEEIGDWEKFEMGEVSDSNPVPPGPSPSDYIVDLKDPIQSNKPFVRMAPTEADGFAYAGEYALRRTEYRDHDGIAHLWQTDGKFWRPVAQVENVESIHAMHTNPMQNGINYATEHICRVYSFSNVSGAQQQYNFHIPRGISVGAGNCGQFGELVACSEVGGSARVAGYKDGAWRELYNVPNKVVWALTEFQGKLLAGCSYNTVLNHPNSGSVVQIEPNARMIFDPPAGICKGFHQKDGTLYAMFGGALYWTTDLIHWDTIEMPGWACWNMIESGPGKLLGVWYTTGRVPKTAGRETGIWLVEFDIYNWKRKIISYWRAPGGSAPYYTGGGIVKLKGQAIGFITVNGMSRPLTVTW